MYNQRKRRERVMAELSENFLGALYQVRASELQDKLAAAQQAGQNTLFLQNQLNELPQTFSRNLMRNVNEPAGAAYEEGLDSLQRQIKRTGGRAGVGEQGAQLALGRGADVVGENLRTIYGEGASPARFNRQLDVSLTPDQISKLQEMGYDPYEFMSEGAATGGGRFNLGRGFRAPTGDVYDRMAARAEREGRDFGLQEGVQFTASAGFNPLSAEFFSGLGMFVDPRTGENLKRPDQVVEYGLSTTDPRERFAQQAEQSLYNRAARAAARGEDEEKFLARLERNVPGRYEQAMAGFEDILAPQGQELGSADPYRQQLQELQGGLGSIVSSAYKTYGQQYAPGQDIQNLASNSNRQVGYGQQQEPTANSGKGASQTPSQTAGKGAGKGATNQQSQVAQNMYSGFS